jgi:hypothetical protein
MRGQVSVAFASVQQPLIPLRQRIELSRVSEGKIIGGIEMMTCSPRRARADRYGHSAGSPPADMRIGPSNTRCPASSRLSPNAMKLRIIRPLPLCEEPAMIATWSACRAPRALSGRGQDAGERLPHRFDLGGLPGRWRAWRSASAEGLTPPERQDLSRFSQQRILQ